MAQKKSQERKNETKYILLIFLAISFLATGGIFVKLSKLPPINTGFYRVLFSIPLLFPFTYKKVRKLNKKEVGLIFLAGMSLAGDLSLWNISFGMTTVANANLLANFTPFLVIPVSYFVFKEKIPKRFLLGTVITFVGIFILMMGKVSPSIENFKGDILAFSTSIFYGSFLLMVYRLRDHIDSMVIMFISAFGSMMVLGIVIAFTEGFSFPISFRELWPLIALALFSQILGQGLLAFCLGKVNATISSIICLTQPVIAAVYAYIVFGEELSIIEILGVLVSLTGVYIAKYNN